MRSISSVNVSSLRSYSFVVRGDSWLAMLRLFERDTVLQVGGDPGCPERVAARAVGHAA
jgi:hypothetical protein